MDKNRLFMLVIAVVIVLGLVMVVLVPLVLDPDGDGWDYELPGDGGANSTAFALYYSEMGLVLYFNVTKAHTVRLWVDSRDTGDHMVGTEEQEDLLGGITTLNMMQLNPGSYVARVIVDDVLVRNLIFEITL
jgi:hypothetical protein